MNIVNKDIQIQNRQHAKEETLSEEPRIEQAPVKKRSHGRLAGIHVVALRDVVDLSVCRAVCRRNHCGEAQLRTRHPTASLAWSARPQDAHAIRRPPFANNEAYHHLHTSAMSPFQERMCTSSNAERARRPGDPSSRGNGSLETANVNGDGLTTQVRRKVSDGDGDQALASYQ